MHTLKMMCCLPLLLSALLFAEGDILQDVDKQKGVFVLPKLPYAYNALEPYINAKTMEIHHDRHHKAYVDNLNIAIANTKWVDKTLPELFAVASTLPESIRYDAGGHWNHTFYWVVMTGDTKKRQMSERLEKELIKNFGSVKKCREEFRNAGLARYGSGYAWIVKEPNGALKITSTPNQDNPLMNDAPVKGVPILGVDVWEHAYYLQYQNHRADYLDAFWNVIDWDTVDKLAFPSP